MYIPEKIELVVWVVTHLWNCRERWASSRITEIESQGWGQVLFPEWWWMPGCSKWAIHCAVDWPGGSKRPALGWPVLASWTWGFLPNLCPVPYFSYWQNLPDFLIPDTRRASRPLFTNMDLILQKQKWALSSFFFPNHRIKRLLPPFRLNSIFGYDHWAASY